MAQLPRVLFVDDDPDVLGGLSKALRKHRDRWEMVFVVGGPEGLEEANRATFDVVVTDMRMPQLDGAALLLAVRDHDPTTFRMILSGFSDHNATTRALPVAHRFFNKPCDLKALAQAIDGSCALRAVFVGAPMQAVVDRLARSASADDIALDPDPAASARTLRLAASIFLGTERPPDASQNSAAVALAALARARLDHPIEGFSLDAHKQYSAEVAERVQRAVAPALAGDALTAGLTHGIGRVVIAAGLPAEHAAIERSVAGGTLRSAAERETLGVTQAELGAYLLTLWGVPLAAIEAVAAQDVGGESPLSAALHAALAG